jgi:hypothetical protein
MKFAYQYCCVCALMTDAAIVVVVVTALAMPKPMPASGLDDELCPATDMPSRLNVTDCGAMWIFDTPKEWVAPPVVDAIVELCAWAMKYSPAESDVTHGIAMKRLLCRNSMKFDAPDVVVKEDVPPVVFVIQLIVIEFDPDVFDSEIENPNDAVVTVVRLVELFDQSCRLKIVIPWVYECLTWPDEFVDVASAADKLNDFSTMMLLNVSASGRTNGLNHQEFAAWEDAAVPVIIGATWKRDIVGAAPAPGAAAERESVNPFDADAVVPVKFVNASVGLP